MTTIPVRQPRGIPAGGQFAATAHAEPATALTAEKPKEPLVEDLLASFVSGKAARDAEVHQKAHSSILADSLAPAEEAQVARAAIRHSLISGDFGTETMRVKELAEDDRLIRLAVDRYVVTESQEPGVFRPHDAGHRLGRLVIDLHEEDIEDGVYGLEEEVDA